MADIMTPEKELKAVQTWIHNVTNLNGWTSKAVPSKLPRPVIIWDTPSRGATWNMTRYEYVVPVKLFGRLCVNSVEEAQEYQGQLFIDLGEKCNVIPVIENNITIRRLRNMQLDFYGSDLDSSFVITYDVSYFRSKPAEAPHATSVLSRFTNKF